MGIQNQFPPTAGKGGSIAVKIMSWQTMLTVLGISQAAVLLLSIGGSIFPEPDIFLSIVGTCAEIIAGLYGITMAGYTFFLSRIDALCATDTTLNYIVGSIKNRFRNLIWFITISVLMNLVVSIVLMYLPIPEQSHHAFLYRLFCNEFLMSTVFSIVLILYYSILVVNPNCIAKEAQKLKKRLSRSTGKPGSVCDFLGDYFRMEELCLRMLPESVLKGIRENKGNRFSCTVELLRAQNCLPLPVIGELIRIHMYYECVLNAGHLSVTDEMCRLTRKTLQYLEELDGKADRK